MDHRNLYCFKQGKLELSILDESIDEELEENDVLLEKAADCSHLDEDKIHSVSQEMDDDTIYIELDKERSSNEHNLILPEQEVPLKVSEEIFNTLKTMSEFLMNPNVFDASDSHSTGESHKESIWDGIETGSCEKSSIAMNDELSESAAQTEETGESLVPVELLYRAEEPDILMGLEAEELSCEINISDAAELPGSNTEGLSNEAELISDTRSSEETEPLGEAVLLEKIEVLDEPVLLNKIETEDDTEIIEAADLLDEMKMQEEIKAVDETVTSEKAEPSAETILSEEKETVDENVILEQTETEDTAEEPAVAEVSASTELPAETELWVEEEPLDEETISEETEIVDETSLSSETETLDKIELSGETELSDETELLDEIEINEHAIEKPKEAERLDDVETSNVSETTDTFVSKITETLEISNQLDASAVAAEETAAISETEMPQQFTEAEFGMESAHILQNDRSTSRSHVTRFEEFISNERTLEQSMIDALLSSHFGEPKQSFQHAHELKQKIDRQISKIKSNKYHI